MSRSPPVESGPYRILIVEDNPGDANLTSELLVDAQMASFDIHAVRTLAEACELLSTPADAVILDLNLPDSLGLDTLRRVREAARGAPLIVVSGMVDDELRRQAIAEGALDVLSKRESNSRLFSRSVLYAIERHRADGHRRQVERLLDVSLDAILVVDAPGKVRYVNEAATRLFGRTRDELLEEVLGFSSQDGVPVELWIPRDGEARIGEMRVASFDWDGAPAYLATIRDITEQRKMETQLVLSDRMTSMGTLAAGIAHEINNPLAAVLANLDLAMQDLADVAVASPLHTQIGDELSDAREAADRVREIVRDVRVFSHPEEERRGPVDVHRVIASALRIAWGEIRNRARVIEDFGVVPPVDANETRLGQVMLNLLVNAAQSIREGGRERNEIRITTGLDGEGRVRIVVADTGAGIPPEVQQRLFTPFFTTKTGTGTGLGLAICRRIVASLGGDISFESRPGEGTRFVVALPAAAEPVRSPEIPAGRRGRVLIVADDPIVSNTARRVISPEHDVTAVESAGAALGLLEGGERFDVILCDLMMPELTGPDFYRWVRSAFPSEAERIVFMTGGSPQLEVRSFLDGIPNHRIEKPFQLPELRALLRRFVG